MTSGTRHIPGVTAPLLRCLGIEGRLGQSRTTEKRGGLSPRQPTGCARTPHGYAAPSSTAIPAVLPGAGPGVEP